MNAAAIALEAQAGSVIVDAADLTAVLPHKWWLKSGPRSSYAYTRLGTGRAARNVSMHRFLLGLTSGGPLVDHVNGNGLDNRRRNLRLADAAENSRNARRKLGCKQPYRGIWPNGNGTFQAFIMASRKRHYLGSFPTAEQAAAAYDTAAKHLHGAFAALNGVTGHPMTPQLNKVMAMAGVQG